MNKCRIIDDFLNLYTERVIELSKLAEESVQYYESELNKIELNIVKPMMIMFNKLPFDVRRQFLKSKCGNVTVEEMKLYVKYLIRIQPEY